MSTEEPQVTTELKKKPQPAPEADKKSKFSFKAPFDLFGIQPSFFISGDDKTITWLGFISTIILVTSIIAVSIFYTIDFFKNKESKVYINDIILNGFPEVRLSNKNFVLMFKHVYPASGQFASEQEKIVKLKAHLITAAPTTPIPYLESRSPLVLAPCNTLALNLTGVSYS